ncbi:MAG: tryptophan synthase subunit alpha, partial [Thermoplasmata archaeon]
MVDASRLRSTRSIARAAREAGADALELGFPFSDPVADGPVLQAASARALRRGTHWGHLLEALDLASEELPSAVMTYANPVLVHGLTDAISELAAHHATGLIVPDLSWEESGPWRAACRKAGISLVQMATPATSLARVRVIAHGSRGFVYLVSHYGTTGRAG